MIGAKAGTHEALARYLLAGGVNTAITYALLLVAIMHFITDAEDPARILAVFRDALPAGSYLAISHATADLRPAAAREIRAMRGKRTMFRE